jgi:DtxR family Mn-dependent transcriptional regulator
MPDPLISLLVAALISFGAYVLLRPERGVLPRWARARQFTQRVRSEDVLKYVHKCEMKGRRPGVESVAGILHLGLDDTAQLLVQLQADDMLIAAEDGIRLTPLGRETALHIIRAHRLWERFLAEETGFNETDWHGQAEQYEHLLTPAQADALAHQLGNPTHDPHGDPIPTGSGEVVAHGGFPLTSLEVDTPAQIVHLEDEPEIVYAQLAAEGLHPGMVVRLIENSAQRVRFWADGDEHLLAPIVASNISIRPLTVEPSRQEYASLATLEPGETAEVLNISPLCHGQERRRFMDLGILAGTKITAELRSAGGDPVAYQIRGALIALRQEQAALINISKSGPSHE